MSSRRRARELAVQALYQADIHKDKGKDSLKNFWEEKGVDADTRSYAEKLTGGVLENLTALDKIITTSSEHWKIDRMAKVDKSIIRIATYEMKMCDVPGQIAINEAIELGKLFGTENSPSFINGVLDSILNAGASGGRLKK